MLQAILGLFGLAVPFSFAFDGAQSTALSVTRMGLPMRLSATLLSAVLIGAGLGLAATWLTRRDNDVTMVLATVMAGAWALMLVVAVDSLAAGTTTTGWPEFSLFMVLALGLSVAMLTTQLSAQMDSATSERVSDRSTVVLIYVAVAVAAALLVRLAP